MAVVFMRKLEEEPVTYETEFTKLTKGINLEVHEWVLNKLQNTDEVLEIGCGPGTLAIKMAKKARSVTAIDKNPEMIAVAKEQTSPKLEEKLNFRVSSVNELKELPKKYDIVVSTFLLSELRPLEQQIFLRNTWKILKPLGKLILAAEFVPSGVWKIGFKIKRWRYKRKLKRLSSGIPHPLKWFNNYIEPIGFKIDSVEEWTHGAIRAMVLVKNPGLEEPGYYFPIKVPYRGIKAKLRIMRCLFTGQVDHVAIEPGLYQSGNPTSESPIIVTSNYIYTYICVMKDLENTDAWVLCIDSRGINVWCAARGRDFGNDQLIEAVEATGIEHSTNQKTLILPQLSAGGVSSPLLKKINFPFNIKYGPVWSKHLPQYLKEKPALKPDRMKIAKFTISHRLRAGISHTTFLLRKIFLIAAIPILILILLTLGVGKLWFVGDFLAAVVLTNMILAIIFPIMNFTRCFVVKGEFMGLINIGLLGSLLYFVHQSIAFTLWNLAFIFWLGLFSTMSFSGYSMASSPREIENEYPTFIKLHWIFLPLGIILSTLGLIFI